MVEILLYEKSSSLREPGTGGVISKIVVSSFLDAFIVCKYGIDPKLRTPEGDKYE
jgi:hypothetical protein